MLKKATITNYRSCVHTELDLTTNLSVLIGANGSGKTNILKALMLLKHLVSSGQQKSEWGAYVTSSLDVTFNGVNPLTDLHAEISLFTDDSNNDIVHSLKERWNVNVDDGVPHASTAPLIVAIHDNAGDQMVAFFQRRRDTNEPPEFIYRRELDEMPSEVRDRLRVIGGFCRGMKYYSASQFTNPGACGVSFEVGEDGRMTSFRTRQQPHTQILYDMYRASCAPENSRYQEFMDIVGFHGLKLIDSLRFKKVLTSSSDTLVRMGGRIEKRNNKRYLVVPTITIGRRHLSPNQLSEGTFKTLVLLFHIMMTESTALLIEEPEVCVHHGLLASILELIKQYSQEKVIILTTHSDFVLDQVEPENVHHVTFSRTKGTEVRHIPNSMSDREYAALRNFLRTEGSLGEYWRSGSLTETP